MFNNVLNRFLASFIFCSILLPAPSYAIRIVLSGGGLGEMIAQSSIVQIPRTLIAVNSHKESLSFSSEQEYVIEKLIDSYFFGINNLELDFHVANSKTEGVRYLVNHPYKISISHSMLYHPNNVSKENLDITKIVFTAWIQSPHARGQIEKLNINFKDWESLVEKIYSYFLYNTDSIYLDNKQSRLWVNQLISLNGEIIDSSLVIEQGDFSLDVTKYATLPLKCLNDNSLTNLHFSGFHKSGSYIKGNVSWSCSGEKYNGTLISPLAQALYSEQFEMKFELVGLNKMNSGCEAELIN